MSGEVLTIIGVGIALAAFKTGPLQFMALLFPSC